MKTTVLSIFEDDKVCPELHRLVRRKVFHSTTLAGYNAILSSKAILSARDNNIERVWNYSSYFYRLGHVSFCDFYHSTRWSDIRDGVMKYTFYRHHNQRYAYLLMLKPIHYDKLTTWSDIKFDATHQVVPHIESGLPSPVPLNFFDEVIAIDHGEQPTLMPR